MKKQLKIIGILLFVLVLVFGGKYVYDLNINHNFETITEGKVYKSGVIPPDELESYVKKYKKICFIWSIFVLNLVTQTSETGRQILFSSHDINPIPFGLFLSNIVGRGGVFHPPCDFSLRVEIGKCDTCL